MDLPEPGSAELLALKLPYQAREIYALLYDNRDSPLTMRQIRDRLSGIGTQEQLDRRRRELNRFFVIEKSGPSRDTAYRLVGRKAEVAPEAGMSEKDRAAVLRHGRCAFCGKTPLEDHVKLQVDHKVPQEWGGTNELENLQPLCEQCNRGKKDFFASYDEYAEELRVALRFDEPQRRIGEFLRVMYPNEVRSDVLEIAANAGAYQEDWQKRLRELRVLGWKIVVRREREDRRVRVYYRLASPPPAWPSGRVRDEIRRRERLRGY